MKFEVYKDGKKVEDFKLCGAYLFGTDGIVVRRGHIDFKKGVINCTRSNLATAGLALLWPIEGFGKVLLPTTCLPKRDRPYILNVEIARAKLMQIVNKREEWAFFNGVESKDEGYHEAQELFIKAIQNIFDCEKASKLADKSLQKAIVFSEKLALRHAKLLFDTRKKNHSFTHGCLGGNIDPDQVDNSDYVKKMLKICGSVNIGINWGQIERSKGVYDFSAIDRCVEVLAKSKVLIGMGPLLCFSSEFLPEWLLKSDDDFEQIRDRVYRFVSEVVFRYSGKVRWWRVVSGLNAYNHFGFGFEEIVEMTRSANMAVKAADERGFRIIEICNPWGEYYATKLTTIPPLIYVDMVIQSGISFDAFGLQMCFGKNDMVMHVRDMMRISAMLDYFGAVSKPLCVTAVEIPSKIAGDDDAAGIWHEVWDESTQGCWVKQFYRIALSKLFVDSVTYANIADSDDSEGCQSGLLTSELKCKESFKVLEDLRKEISGRNG